MAVATFGEWVIGEPVVAAVAAAAAAGVPGVVRLEPGVFGLVGSLGRTLRQQVKGLDPAPTEGVRVSYEGNESVRVEVDLVLSGAGQVAAVAQAVQRAVAGAVAAATGLAVAAVSVAVLDVEVRGGW
ncbi:Asp23/Gls24 family envelope stress response protein [Amycolatopsis sp. 195334CR]|nr:Asp23/Gls24 family envelope stress response protein [Amycolatopsis sp. 195334CR]